MFGREGGPNPDMQFLADHMEGGGDAAAGAAERRVREAGKQAEADLDGVKYTGSSEKPVTAKEGHDYIEDYSHPQGPEAGARARQAREQLQAETQATLDEEKRILSRLSPAERDARAKRNMQAVEDNMVGGGNTDLGKKIRRDKEDRGEVEDLHKAM